MSAGFHIALLLRICLASLARICPGAVEEVPVY